MMTSQSASMATLTTAASSLALVDGGAAASDRQVNEICLELLNAEAVAHFLAVSASTTPPAPAPPTAPTAAATAAPAKPVRAKTSTCA